MAGVPSQSVIAPDVWTLGALGLVAVATAIGILGALSTSGRAVEARA